MAAAVGVAGTPAEVEVVGAVDFPAAEVTAAVAARAAAGDSNRDCA